MQMSYREFQDSKREGHQDIVVSSMIILDGRSSMSPSESRCAILILLHHMQGGTTLLEPCKMRPFRNEGGYPGGAFLSCIPNPSARPRSISGWIAVCVSGHYRFGFVGCPLSIPTARCGAWRCIGRLYKSPTSTSKLSTSASDRKSTRLNSSHSGESRMPSSA